MTNSVFDPRTGKLESVAREVRSCWTCLLLDGFSAQQDLLPVFKARKSLDRLYCALEKHVCDYDGLVASTLRLEDCAEFWDNFAAIMVGVKTRTTVSSGMVKDMLVKCKLKAAMFLGEEFYAGSADFKNLLRCYGALLKAGIEGLDGAGFLAGVEGQPLLRQLAEYYGDVSSDLSVLDACCLAEAGESALAGVSAVARDRMLSWIGSYFSNHSDDSLSSQFTCGLINQVLGQLLCCQDFDALVSEVEERVKVAESYGVYVLDKKYLDYALGQVKSRM